MTKKFDVIVVGGGHAGLEAAAASSRLGATTALFTLKIDQIGELSCNPAIGGIGKGHLVREIDALDGLMGRLADAAGIQFRLLNRSKGPAVRGPRTQIDRTLYKQAAQDMLQTLPNLWIFEAMVKELVFSHQNSLEIQGIETIEGTIFNSDAIVLTTGTFLNGTIHIGSESFSSGRLNDPASTTLSRSLISLGLPLRRLKTGTPARLSRNSIQWDRLEKQKADDNPVPFSTLTEKILQPQISCGITHTNKETHGIILKYIHQSAIYSGNIQSAGPRYCPSIEDKVVRFASRDQHQIFLEPEGLTSDIVYPNGISTSLPKLAQSLLIHSIEGLEQAKIIQYGYAIEYDCIDPKCLSTSLALKTTPGLFFAGQINGTTGYEEAAAQGLVAGMNAARYAQQKEPVFFERTESYIGVMINDLITLGSDEPYRMFTSRSEYRLSLRADNADLRLTPKGIDIGIISAKRKEAFHNKLHQLNCARENFLQRKLPPTELSKYNIKINQDGILRSAKDLLSYPSISYSDICRIWPDLQNISPSILEQLTTEAIYDGYLKRQQQDIAVFNNEDGFRLSCHIKYKDIHSLSQEARESLEKHLPETIFEAKKLQGVTPASILALIHYLS